MKEVTDRAKAWKCVRLNDKKGFSTKFNKSNFPNESRREMYYYSVKCVEQGMRGFSPTLVATKTKFEKFGKVTEGLKLKPLPEGFESFSHTKKREMVEKLVVEFDNDLAAAVSRAPVQVVDMQVKNPDPGEIQVDEVLAAAPNPGSGSTLSNDTSSQNVAWNQCDNSQGQSPPSRPPVPLEEVVFLINDLMLRASRFPGILPKFEWSEKAFRSFVIQLESLEGAFEDRPSAHLRSDEEEFYAKLEDFSGISACQAVTSMPSMEESLENEFWGNLPLLRPETFGTSPNLYAE